MRAPNSDLKGRVLDDLALGRGGRLLKFGMASSQRLFSGWREEQEAGTLRDLIRSPAWACVGDVPYSFLTRTTPSTAAPRLPAVPCAGREEAPVGFSPSRDARHCDAHVLGVAQAGMAQAIEAMLNK